MFEKKCYTCAVKTVTHASSFAALPLGDLCELLINKHYKNRTFVVSLFLKNRSSIFINYPDFLLFF